MSLEQKINYQLNKYPGVKRYIKRGYQLAMYAISPKIKSEGDIVRVSPNDGKEYFRCKQVEHTKNPNVGQFDVLLEQNQITPDLRLCRPSGNGDTYSFKIKKKGMSLLFPESVIYNV